MTIYRREKSIGGTLSLYKYKQWINDSFSEFVIRNKLEYILEVIRLIQLDPADTGL